MKTVRIILKKEKGNIYHKKGLTSKVTLRIPSKSFSAPTGIVKALVGANNHSPTYKFSTFNISS